MGLDLHGKNLSVVIVLVTLSLCALFAAKGTTNLVAVSVMPLAAGEPVLASAGKRERPPGAEAPDVKSILKRNIFDSETGALWPPKPPPTPEEDPNEVATDEPQALAPGQMPPPCQGSLKMVASVYSPGKPEWSFATLSSGQDAPLLYRAGASVDGKEVDSIYPKAVFMKDGGKLCSLTMFDENKPTAAASARPTNAPPATTPTKPNTPTRSGGVGQDDLEKNITKVSDTNYKVNRTLIDKLLTNQAELMRAARVVPHQQNGETVGVKLYGIRRKSVLGQLGLQNGDLLRTINGFDMASPDSALEAYTRLRSADNLSVSVTRRGRAMTLDYNIE